jgi:hypothetical protein
MYQSYVGIYGSNKHSSSGEKLGTDSRIGQPVCCGLCWKPFFSGPVTLSNTVGDSQRVAICGLREIHMVLYHTRTEHEKRVACWSGFPLYGVDRFESSRLSDMSNRLFVTVIT